jgi:hypothetical protein
MLPKPRTPQHEFRHLVGRVAVNEHQASCEIGSRREQVGAREESRVGWTGAEEKKDCIFLLRQSWLYTHLKINLRSRKCQRSFEMQQLPISDQLQLQYHTLQEEA